MIGNCKEKNRDRKRQRVEKPKSWRSRAPNAPSHAIRLHFKLSIEKLFRRTATLVCEAWNDDPTANHSKASVNWSNATECLLLVSGWPKMHPSKSNKFPVILCEKFPKYKLTQNGWLIWMLEISNSIGKICFKLNSKKFCSIECICKRTTEVRLSAFKLVKTLCHRTCWLFQFSFQQMCENFGTKRCVYVEFARAPSYFPFEHIER